MTSPLRVLVLSSVFPNPQQPTLGIFVRERIRLVARACELVVVAPIPWFPMNRRIRGPQWSDIPKEEWQDGLRVLHPRFFCVPRYLKCLDGFLYACSLAPFLARLRRTFPFDLIDAHFAYPDGLAAVLLGKLFRRPVTITLRGSIVRLSTYSLHRPQLRFALRGASRVLAVSNSLRSVAVGIGISPEKIRVIPNGVDTSTFSPMDQAVARRALGLPLDRTIVLSIGGLNEGKGHHRIVGLLPGLLHHCPDLLYVVVGGARRGDSVRPLLEGLITQHGLEHHVLLPGERPHQEIPQWLGAADLFCLATKSEGWPNVLLEALACGKPVVATRVGGVPEIVTRDAFGILVPPDDDDALARGINQALSKEWNPEAMLAHASTHSWESVASEVLGEFRQIAPREAVLPSGERSRVGTSLPRN